MKVVVVTGYVPLPVTHRSEAEYAAYGQQLFATGVPIVAFVPPELNLQVPENVTRLPTSFADCWYAKLLTPGTQNPVTVPTNKDTLEYYAVQHQKSTWIAQALKTTGADVAIWVDFGIFHLGNMTPHVRTLYEVVSARPPTKITIPSCRAFTGGVFDYSQPQWYCAGGVLVVPAPQARWFDSAARQVAAQLISKTGMATWEVNTWATIVYNQPDRFQLYQADHTATLFSRYPGSPSMLKIAVYALARNEADNAEAWAACCADADYRIVTDTGSTDGTQETLRSAGVTVCTGAVVPWRWDDAHTLSLNHVPADADICVRLDLDERLLPGWREALLRAWTPGMTKLRYWYAWSLSPAGQPLIRFHGDRVHSRGGYRWVGATHEALARWDGEEVTGFSDEFTIHHHRAPDKTHASDLALLQQAAKESPKDPRMQWYLARQLFIDGNPAATYAFEKYLSLPDGNSLERAFAYRVLAHLHPDAATGYLTKSAAEHPSEPSAYYMLASLAHNADKPIEALHWAIKALDCSPLSQGHTSEPAAFSHLPADIASVSAYKLGMLDQALKYAEVALARNPKDTRLRQNVEKLRDQLAGKA